MPWAFIGSNAGDDEQAVSVFSHRVQTDDLRLQTVGVLYGHAYALGAADDSGVDYYLAASKVWLDALFGRNVTGSLTLRYTGANQTGTLGFGGGDAELAADGSLAVFLNR